MKNVFYLFADGKPVGQTYETNQAQASQPGKLHNARKMLLLLVMVASFSLFGANKANAQYSVQNCLSCDIEVTFHFDNPLCMCNNGPAFTVSVQGGNCGTIYPFGFYSCGCAITSIDISETNTPFHVSGCNSFSPGTTTCSSGPTICGSSSYTVAIGTYSVHIY
jgi:hypothetical protein